MKHLIKKYNRNDKISKILTKGSGMLFLLIVITLFAVLLIQSYPVIHHVGILDLFTNSAWQPNHNHFGIIIPLTGTLLTTLIAGVIAIPVGIGTALFISEYCPFKIRAILSIAIELLAAIPSIVYGLWGYKSLAPFSANYIQPLITNTLGKLPFVGSFFSSADAIGTSAFVAGLVLAIMIIPFIASFTRDSLNQVPAVIRESAFALGATHYEVVRDVMLPFAMRGLMTGIIMAIGRALGETMAVAYVIGNSPHWINNIFQPFATITSTITAEFKEASGVHISGLLFLALILLIVNTITILLAKRYANKRSKV